MFLPRKRLRLRVDFWVCRNNMQRVYCAIVMKSRRASQFVRFFPVHLDILFSFLVLLLFLLAPLGSGWVSENGDGNESIVKRNPLPIFCGQALQNYHRNFCTNEMRTLLDYCLYTPEILVPPRQRERQQKPRTEDKTKNKYITKCVIAVGWCALCCDIGRSSLPDLLEN